MNVATIITVSSVTISTIAMCVAVLLASAAIEQATIDRDQKIALATERINAIRRSLTAATDAAMNRQIEDRRSIEYLTLQIETLQGQLERERSAAMNRGT